MLAAQWRLPLAYVSHLEGSCWHVGVVLVLVGRVVKQHCLASPQIESSAATQLLLHVSCILGQEDDLVAASHPWAHSLLQVERHSIPLAVKAVTRISHACAVAHLHHHEEVDVHDCAHLAQKPANSSLSDFGMKDL